MSPPEPTLKVQAIEPVTPVFVIATRYTVLSKYLVAAFLSSNLAIVPTAIPAGKAITPVAVVATLFKESYLAIPIALPRNSRCQANFLLLVNVTHIFLF
jgi:hypothetical protein